MARTKCHHSSPPHPGSRPTAVNKRRARLPSVRRVFFGGDVFTTEMVASIRRLAPNATIGSFYGATETQRAVGYFEIPNDSAADESRSTQNHSTRPRYQRRTTARLE